MTISGMRRFFPGNSGLFLFTLLAVTSCQPAQGDGYARLSGETMGTYYSVVCRTGDGAGLQSGIDSVLARMQALFSTYDSTSMVSRFNRSAGKSFCFRDRGGHFGRVLEVSGAVARESGGAFDPTVMPLVSYWGFGPERIRRADFDTLVIDSLLGVTGWDNLSWRHDSAGQICLERLVAGLSLDFSAVAKGYGVDVVGRFLETAGIEDYMVEIGGEVTARGKNPAGQWWRIGIESPLSPANLEARRQQAVVELKGKSLASSGNYRNFYEIDGRPIGHTIHPKTGLPEQNNLLAVSVLTHACAYADALATGFMVSGYPRAREMADSLPGVEALFIYLDDSGAIATDLTPGFASDLLE